MEAVRPVREGLLAKHENCMVCGHSPRRPWPDKPRESSQLCCHEIASGPLRDKALDQPYALLVVCWFCNGYRLTNRAAWPEAKQLAVLRRKAPENFDLKAYNRLVNPRAPNRITIEEVLEA